MKSILTILLLCLTMSTVTFSQKKKVAVYVVEDKSWSPNIKKSSNIFANALMKEINMLPQYSAVERSKQFLAQLGAEHNYQRTGSVDENQIAELGKQFAVDFVLAITIEDQGDNEWYVVWKLIDVESAEVPSMDFAMKKVTTPQEVLAFAKELAQGVNGGGEVSGNNSAPIKRDSNNTTKKSQSNSSSKDNGGKVVTGLSTNVKDRWGNDVIREAKNLYLLQRVPLACPLYLSSNESTTIIYKWYSATTKFGKKVKASDSYAHYAECKYISGVLFEYLFDNRLYRINWSGTDILSTCCYDNNDGREIWKMNKSDIFTDFNIARASSFKINYLDDDFKYYHEYGLSELGIKTETNSDVVFTLKYKEFNKVRDASEFNKMKKHEKKYVQSVFGAYVNMTLYSILYTRTMERNNGFKIVGKSSSIYFNPDQNNTGAYIQPNGDRHDAVMYHFDGTNTDLNYLMFGDGYICEKD